MNKCQLNLIKEILKERTTDIELKREAISILKETKSIEFTIKTLQNIKLK
jgi:hypothetical protein